MQLGFWSCIPILVLIIGGFATKRVTETLILSTLIGAVLIYRGTFFGEYVGMIYEVLSNDSFQFILILLIGIGSIIRLYERSGALAGFRSLLKRWATTPKRSVLITWLLCFVLFIDDYLILLTASSSMKKLTDAAGVPREHLAYTVNALGASVCILVPFTSWSSFTVSQIEKVGMAFSDYVHSLPYMFFPIASVAVSFLLAADACHKQFHIPLLTSRSSQGISGSHSYYNSTLPGERRSRIPRHPCPVRTARGSSALHLFYRSAHRS